MNELVNVDDDLPISNVPMAKLEATSENSFLPYVKLVGSTAAEAENFAGQFVLVKEKGKPISLTNSFECLVLAARPKACRMVDKKVISCYDIDSDEYKAIEAESALKHDGPSGAWHGAEYLIWVRSNRTWATYHASSVTARQRSAELNTILKNWSESKKRAKIDPSVVSQNPQVVFKSGMAKYTKANQYAASYTPATTPFSDLPTYEEMKTKVLKFMSPPIKEKVVVVQPAAEQRG